MAFSNCYFENQQCEYMFRFVAQCKGIEAAKEFLHYLFIFKVVETLQDLIDNWNGRLNPPLHVLSVFGVEALIHVFGNKLFQHLLASPVPPPNQSTEKKKKAQSKSTY
jgi:hypothetical protein